MHLKRQAFKKKINKICFLAIIFLSSAVFAAKDAPIHIEADRMVSQEQENSVVFIGNVDARQDDIIIRTDEMTVFYVPTESGEKIMKGSSSVDKLICKGNVEISRANWLGTGNRMDYYASERKVILTGDAKAWKDQNMVSGKKIIYYLDEGRSVVEGGTEAVVQDLHGEQKSGRVQAVIHPDSNNK
jgi:lipopolysaccharide export system protein LptA